MKELLKKQETRQMAVLIGLAIVCGIAIHQIFFIVAQVLALATCVYLMVVAVHERRSRKTSTH